MHIIVLTGMPASGKSTAAKVLKGTLRMPVLEKDAFKEAIFDTMGFSCYAEKRKTDHAANAVLLRCVSVLLESGQSLIVDNNFDDNAAKELEKLVKEYDCKCITVVFGGDIEAFYHRYVERDRMKLRHLGHVLQERYPPAPGDPLEHDMTREEFQEKFVARGMMNFSCSGERIDIDATDPSRIDMDALIDHIRRLL